MKQLYLKDNNPFFLLSTITLLTILFFLFQPAAKSFIRPDVAKSYILSFIDQTIENGTIQSQDFWKSREFSSTGSFRYQREGLSEEIIQDALQNHSITLKTSELYPFLVYSSPSWNSIEFLTTTGNLNILFPDIANSCQTILFEKPNEIICQTESDTFLIVFVKSQEEMKKANAFFDYKGRDGKIVEGKNWLVISTVEI